MEEGDGMSAVGGSSNSLNILGLQFHPRKKINGWLKREIGWCVPPRIKLLIILDQLALSWGCFIPLVEHRKWAVASQFPPPIVAC